MCGRYALVSGAEELVEAFDVPLPGFELVARYNIAPGQDVPVVAEDRRGRRMGRLRWGLVPGWKDQPGSGLVNARSETVRTTPSFRDAFSRRRCLVPADGFYEWRREGDLKVPHWFRPRDGSVVSFAGIWERWSRPDAEPRHTFAILTTDANEDVAPFHDRMPVVVAPEHRALWLSRASDSDDLAGILRPAPRGTFGSHEVSTRVNRADEDDPGLIEPLAAAG
jgi:putative SOS response-associated peptidase YedK